MLRYAITDRRIFPGGERQQLDALFAQAARLASEGVDFLQIREKDLPERALEALTRRVVESVDTFGQTAPKVLLNGPAHVAVAACVSGVHLPGESGLRQIETVRQTFQAAGLGAPIISTSCHSIAEVRLAALAAFDTILFGPVFEKRVHGELVDPGLGLDQLRQASQLTLESRLLALGGVRWENAPMCMEAGAAGIAGIRMFMVSRRARQDPLPNRSHCQSKPPQ